MPKIALVSPYTLPFYSGNSILAQRLVDGLSGRGFTVAVYDALRNDSDDALAFAPDILHTLNADKTYPWAERFLAKRPIPWVITFTGTDYSSWCGTAEPPDHIAKSLARVAAVTVFHEEAARDLRNSLPAIAAKVRVIAQGVARCKCREDRMSLRGRFGMAPDDTVFLMVAGIRPVKNLGLAVEAFAEVARRGCNARLFLVGPVMDQREADRVLSMGNALHCLTYLGARPPEEVRKIMRAADVLLNTSLHEGMPGALLEAMAEGLPVVASAVPGNTALIRHGENGLLFDPGNGPGLVDAVIRLSAAAGLRKTLGSEGRRIARKRYSVTREMAEYSSLYASLPACPVSGAQKDQ